MRKTSVKMNAPVAKEVSPDAPETSRDWVEAIEAAQESCRTDTARTNSNLKLRHTVQEPVPFGMQQEKLAMAQLSGGQLNETAAREAGGMTYRKWQLGEIMESKAVRCFFVSIVLVNAVLIGIRVC